MAFQVSDIKIIGTINGISFYHSVDGWLVRQKGGPSRKQFKTSPAFARSRENSAEFSSCSKAASQIRHQLRAQAGIRDKTLYHRLLSLMRGLANEDKTSPRGQREPHKGINSPAGQKLLAAFEIAPGLNLLDFLFPKPKHTPTKRRRSPQRTDRILRLAYPNQHPLRKAGRTTTTAFSDGFVRWDYYSLHVHSKPLLPKNRSS